MNNTGGISFHIRPCLEDIRSSLERELQLSLGSDITQNTLAHCKRVSLTAPEIARSAGLNTKAQKKTLIAGFLHDCAKDLRPEDLKKECHNINISANTAYDFALAGIFLHAPVGAKFALQKFGIRDPEILKAISGHMNHSCSNNPDQDMVLKIVLLADSIEPARTGKRVAIVRDLIKQGKFEKAVSLIHISSSYYELQQLGVLHPRKLSHLSALLRKEGSELSHKILNGLHLLPNVSNLDYKASNIFEKIQSFWIDRGNAKNKKEVLDLLHKLFFKILKER